MKTIIAGSRDFDSYTKMVAAIEASGIEIIEIVSGDCRGADALGERYADENNIPVTKFMANWNQHGKAAGPIRNEKMADYAEALIAFPIGVSKGTRSMIREANKRKLKVFVVES